MACIRQIKGRWYVDFRDESGRRHREVAKGKKAAEGLLARRVHEVEQGSYSAEGRRVKFGPFALEWLETMEPEWSAATRDLNRYLVETHLLNPSYGLAERRISKITLRTCETFKADMVKANPKLKARSVNLALQVLGRLLRHAQAHRLRFDDPSAFVRRVKSKREEIAPLTSEQAQRLLAAAEAEGPDIHLAVSLGLRAGLRLGESLGLCWRDVDTAERVLRITGTNSHKAYREVFTATGKWPTVKTEASARKVPCSPALVAELLRYKLSCGRPEPGALLFSREDGTPLNPSGFRARPWKRCLRAAGLPESTNYHTLRHSFATQLLAAGVSPEWVRLALGHRTLAVTLSVYRHYLPRVDAQNAEAIDRALAAGSGQ